MNRKKLNSEPSELLYHHLIRKVIGWALLVSVLFVVSVLVSNSVTLTVDPADAYHYLGNARHLAGHNVSDFFTTYIPIRPPLIPVFHSLIMFSYEAGGAGWSYAAPHLLSIIMAVLSLLAVYLLLKESFSDIAAGFGVLILAINPVFLRYAPTVMTDIGGMLLLVLAFINYLKGKKTNALWRYAFAGILLGLSILAKDTSILAIGGFAVFEIAYSYLYRKENENPLVGPLLRSATKAGPWVTVLLGTGIWYFGHALVQIRLFGFSSRAFTFVFEMYANQFLRNSPGNPGADPWFEYFLDILMVFTPLVVLIILVGLIFSAVKKEKADILHLSWLVVFLFFQTFVITHKEVRYLFPIFPSLIHLAIRGGQGVLGLFAQWSEEKRYGPKNALSIIGALAVLILPINEGVSMYFKLKSPAFTKPFLADISREILQKVPLDGNVFWMNNRYTIYPENPDYLKYDEYFFFNHISPEGMEYFLDRPVRPVSIQSPDKGMDHKSILIQLFEKDGALIQSLPAAYWTANMAAVPEPPLPLSILYIYRDRLIIADANKEAGKNLYVGRKNPNLRMEMELKLDGLFVENIDLEKGWSIYAKSKSGIYKISAGTHLLKNPEFYEAVRVEVKQYHFR